MRLMHAVTRVPKARMNSAVPLLILLHFAVCGPADAASIPEASQPELLISECELIDGEEINFLGWRAIDDEGNWSASVSVQGDVGRVLFYNGVELAREGDPAPAPAGETIRGFNLFETNGLGQLTVLFDVTPGVNSLQRLPDRNNPVLSTFDLVAIEGDPAPNAMPGSSLTNLGWSRPHDAHQLLLAASTDDPSAPTILYLWNLPASGPGISDSTRIAAVGETLPGQTDPVTSFPSDDWSLNGQGHALFRARGGSFDAIYSWDGSLTKLAQVGEPSPVAGRNWDDVSGSLSLGKQGDVLMRARIDGDQQTDGLIALNGIKWIQEGDPAPGIPGSPPLRMFDDAPAKIDGLGRILWIGDWVDDANMLPERDALFVDQTPVIQEFSTEVSTPVGEGLLLLSLLGNVLSFSENGRWAIFEAIFGPGNVVPNIDPCLSYPQRGFFRVDLMPPLFTDNFESGDVSDWSSAVP